MNDLVSAADTELFPGLSSRGLPRSAALRRRHPSSADQHEEVQPDRLGGSQEPSFHPECHAEVATMRLEELRSAGLVIEIYSSLLEDRFLLVSDGVEVPSEEKRACYSVAEMEGLLGLDAEELKAIHAVKRRFRCVLTVEDA